MEGWFDTGNRIPQDLIRRLTGIEVVIKTPPLHAAGANINNRRRFLL